MISSLLPAIKQSLNKAYRLRKPERAAIEAFRDNFIHLLHQLDEKKSKENVKTYLMNILQDTYFASDYQRPENSSPVCYAHLTGLRDSFIEPILPELETPPEFDNNPLPGTSRTNAVNSDLREALNAITYSVRQILTTNQVYLTTDNTAIEKQIDQLVYQLYALTPEEITIVEENKK